MFQSKLANVLFSVELQRRLEGLQQEKRRINSRSAAKRVLAANAVHPGNVQTEVRMHGNVCLCLCGIKRRERTTLFLPPPPPHKVTRNMPPVLYWGQRLCSPFFLLYQKTPPLGAYTTVHVATSPALRGVGGQYFVNGRPTEDVNPLVKDAGVAERLWAVSEAAVGLGDGGSGGEGEGTPARGRARRRRSSVDAKADGGKRSPPPQRRRRSLRRTASKGKLD